MSGSFLPAELDELVGYPGAVLSFSLEWLSDDEPVDLSGYTATFKASRQDALAESLGVPGWSCAAAVVISGSDADDGVILGGDEGTLTVAVVVPATAGPGNYRWRLDVTPEDGSPVCLLTGVMAVYGGPAAGA